MPIQSANWTCSACALAWALRATAADVNADEWGMVSAIGQPENINPVYGLMEGSGVQLQRVLTDYGLDSKQGWLTFEQAYSIARQYTGMISGGAWYHWVALRGIDNYDTPELWIANSAPGYMGIWDSLSRADFQRLGPFSVVWIPSYL